MGDSISHQPTELTAEQLDNIRVRARVEGNATFTALLAHADALAAKVARLESRWQKDAMQIDTDMDDLREERDDALAKFATTETLCDSLKAKVARLEGERAYVRSLKVVGINPSSGALSILDGCDATGIEDAVPFGDVIDKAMEDSAHVAHD